MLNIVPTFIRKYFARSFNNGELVDATMLASQDAQNADFSTALNQCRARLNAISTAAGSLRYALVSMNTATATAGQTAFTVTTYDNTAGASFVIAFSGTALIPPGSVAQTSTTVVTIPAQLVGTAVVIAIFGAGNGTSQLASTSAGQGASLIGINDAGSLLVSTEVESALQEIATNLASAAYVAGIIGLANYIKKDGSVVFTGNQAMGAHKITGLAAGTASSDDAARMADITPAALQAALGTFLSTTYVPLSGNVTMTGPLDFGSLARITNLPAGVASGEPITFDQLSTLFGAGKNAIINGSGILANGQDYAASVSGTYGYGKIELCKGVLTGSTVAGTLTQGTGSAIGASGFSIKWSAVTTTGSGVAIWRFWIEDINAKRFRNQTASLGFKFLNGAVASVAVTANIYKPTTTNGFGTLTLIGSSSASTAMPATELDFTYTGIAMGDCANGILVEISSAIGAVTNKSFELTDVQLELGSVASTVEYESASITLLKSQRYFVSLNYTTADTVFSGGFCTSTTRAIIPIHLPVPMSTTAGYGLTSSAANQFALTDGTTATTATAVGTLYNSDRTPSLAVDVASGLTAFRPIVLINKSGSTPHLDFDARLL